MSRNRQMERKKLKERRKAIAIQLRAIWQELYYTTSTFLVSFFTLYETTISRNFNIYLCKFITFFNALGHKSTNNTPPQNCDNKMHKDSVLDADSSSTKSGRRPSLDTVSTYLSQESRESQVTASTADLINCSASSDDGIDSQDLPSIVGK